MHGNLLSLVDARKVRITTKNEEDAKSVALGLGRIMHRDEYIELVDRLAGKGKSLEYSQTPSKPSLEDLADQIETGRVEPEHLTHTTDRNEDNKEMRTTGQ